MRPRFRVGFGLTSSGSGRVRAEPTRPDSISAWVKTSTIFTLCVFTFLKKNKFCLSVLAADIPLHKLNHPFLKSLFAVMGKILLLKTAARACVAKLASQKEEQIQDFGKKSFFNCG